MHLPCENAGVKKKNIIETMITCQDHRASAVGGEVGERDKLCPCASFQTSLAQSKCLFYVASKTEAAGMLILPSRSD